MEKYSAFPLSKRNTNLRFYTCGDNKSNIPYHWSSVKINTKINICNLQSILENMACLHNWTMEIVLPFDSVNCTSQELGYLMDTNIHVCVYTHSHTHTRRYSFECCNNKRKNLGKWLNIGTSTWNIVHLWEPF